MSRKNEIRLKKQRSYGGIFTISVNFTLSCSHELGELDACLRWNDALRIPVIPAKAGIHVSNNTET